MYEIRFIEQEIQYLIDVCNMTLDDPGRLDSMTLLAVEDLYDRMDCRQFNGFTRVDVYTAKLLMDLWGTCEPLYDEEFLEILWIKLNEL